MLRLLLALCALLPFSIRAAPRLETTLAYGYGSDGSSGTIEAAWRGESRKAGFGAFRIFAGGPSLTVDAAIPHGDFVDAGWSDLSGATVLYGFRGSDRLWFRFEAGLATAKRVVRSNATGWTWQDPNESVKVLGEVGAGLELQFHPVSLLLTGTLRRGAVFGIAWGFD